MKQTSEAAFETAIEAVLLNDGYSKLASGAFDTERAIFPDEALTFIRETQSKTWEKLEAANAAFPRRAQFRCTLVLAWPDGHDEVFEGIMPGQVVWPMRGAQGHGYDPVFQPDGYEITFGEMAAEEKNRISHRADAFRKFVAGCFA